MLLRAGQRKYPVHGKDGNSLCSRDVIRRLHDCGRLAGFIDVPQFAFHTGTHEVNFSRRVNPARRVAFPEHIAVGADEVRERPGRHSVGFGVAAVRIPEHGMFKVPGLHHAAHDVQRFPDTLIDFNDDQTGV